MNRIKLVVSVVIAALLVVICVLSYNLYQEHKWGNIYFRHMMQAEQQLDQVKKQGGKLMGESFHELGLPIDLDGLSDGEYSKVNRLGGVNYAVVYKNEGDVRAVYSTSEIPAHFVIKNGRKNPSDFLK